MGVLIFAGVTLQIFLTLSSVEFALTSSETNYTATEKIGATVIDLTYDLASVSLGWRHYPQFNPYKTEQKVEPTKFAEIEHQGTHAEIPGSFDEAGIWHSHDVHPSRLIGPGVVIDVSAKVKDTTSYALNVDDIQEFEKVHGDIPENAVVLLCTGWGSRYPDEKEVFNGGYNLPSVSVDAARFLSDQREIIALGIDTPSVDVNPQLPAVHEKLLNDNILILENVANVDKLPPKGTTIVIGMLKIHGATGSPARIVAIRTENAVQDSESAEERIVPVCEASRIQTSLITFLCVICCWFLLE